MKPINKGIVVAVMLTSISTQALDMAAFARGGGRRGGSGWSMNRGTFMRQNFNRFDSGRDDFGQRMGSTRDGIRGGARSASRAFDRGGIGGGHGAVGMNGAEQRQMIDSQTDRASHVRDYNWGKSSDPAAKIANVATQASKNPIAKPTFAKNPAAKAAFAKDHPRRSEVLSRDKFADARHGKFHKAHTLPNQPVTKPNVPKAYNGANGTTSAGNTIGNTPGSTTTGSAPAMPAVVGSGGQGSIANMLPMMSSMFNANEDPQATTDDGNDQSNNTDSSYSITR